ncbi:glycosyltransferase family 2 protein [Flavobacterium sp.]|jgi:glycosyltransferase involved in cell wall biosynthesis|uniref:glycosyltransferase family 2 protein n=1 Tax=Flavobacterium sp. TaxID=239 RepID=UPI0037BFD94B
MQNNIKISVVTINYNNPQGLKKTIESVVNQTYKDFEYIIIDGGSNEEDVTIIKAYQNQINYWLSEPDKGIYNAMNKGIKQATGQFVIFLNSGDNFTNSKVLEEVQHQLKPDYDLYYGDYFRVKSNSKRRKTFPENLSFSFFYTGSLAHPATFFKRTLFDEIFYYNESYKIVSDWEFYIYAICYKNIKYHYLRMVISDFDFTGISSNPKFKDLERQERKSVLEKYFPLFLDDYEKLSLLNSKRFKQILHIQNSPILWSLFKGFISLFLLFTTKIKK